MSPPGRAPATFLALVVLAGCLGSVQPDAPSSREALAPNFVGDWSSVNGTFALHRLQIRLDRTDPDGNETRPLGPSSCVRPFVYAWDPGNGTLRVDRELVALHPSAPTPLRVVLLEETVRGDACVDRNLFGVHEGTPAPKACRASQSQGDAAPDLPWRCDVPVAAPGRAAAFWLNMTVALDAPGGYRLAVNGATWNGEATWDVHGGPERIVARVTSEPLGTWPYDAVVRRGLA